MAPETTPTTLPEQQVQQLSFNESMKELALKYPEGLVPTIDDLDAFKSYAEQITFNNQTDTYSGPSGETLNPALARRTLLNAEFDWRMPPETRSRTIEVLNALQPIIYKYTGSITCS